MKITLYIRGQEPTEVEVDRLRIRVGLDHFELRAAPSGGLLMRLEEHDGGLSGDLAILPGSSCNVIRLKGGIR